MRTKILACFLFCQMAFAYGSYGAGAPKTLWKANPVNSKHMVPDADAGESVRGRRAFASSPAPATLDAKAAMFWSDNATWASFGATKPVAGSSVTIPEGIHIILDESTPDLLSLNISGKLEFADKDLSLTAGWIMVMGALEVGTAATPFTHKATITLNAINRNETIMGMGTRGIMVMGGKLELHGVPPSRHITKINDHAAAGATTLSLLDPVSWNVDDQVVVATSDYYGAGNGTAQRTRVAAINGGNSLTIQDGLNAQRWGKLQYLTATGMSLTPGMLPENLLPGTPTVLDERAEVANLTRNIVVQSVDDALWQNNGFGCHIMIMRMNGMVGEAHLDGVEIRRGGQAGKLGRYPFHWHMLSYQGSTTLPDATGQYIRNSTVNQSANRGIVIHGTNGVEVKNNVVYDVRGHGIFTEDASERRNIIDGNLVMRVRDPLRNNVLKLHEADGNASGFWISNPDNTIINNTATDCSGKGFWLAFPDRTFGASAGIDLKPNYTKFGVFNNNHAHSNQNQGIHLDDPEVDELGNTGGARYTSTTDMKAPQWPYPTVLTYELADYSIWKNNRTGIWNRSASARNRRVVAADNTSKFFSGASDNVLSGEIEKTLVVGISLNYNMNGVIVPNTYDAGEPPVAFASYHSTFDIKDNVIVNFPGVQGKASGAFAIDDYYLAPVDKGTVRNPNNILINSHPGVRTLPREPQFVFGVVWDHHNYWGGDASKDNYYVFNTPFFTHGLTPHVVAPNPSVSGGVIVPGPFYGFANYKVNRIDRTYDEINVIRTAADGSFIGNWTVAAGWPGSLLGNMRHFATHPKGFYYLDFPDIDVVNEFVTTVSNMLTTDDYQVLSVKYSGDYTIQNLFASIAYNMNDFGGSVPFPVGDPNTRPYAPVADFQAVVNAPTGEVYWQDKANNKVWFKVRGGLKPEDKNISPNNDWNLYREFNIRAYGTFTPRVTYAVTFTVKDGANAPLAGASVTFNGQTVVSGADGTASFANVAPGNNLAYTVSKTDFANSTGTLNVVASNVSQQVVLSPVSVATYTVTFTVKDGANAPLAGASVAFNGQTVVSGADGTASFANVAPGNNLAYTVSKTGFNNASGTVNVASANLSQDIILSAVGSPTYTVTFTVRDGAGSAVAGASVAFNGRTVTSDANGVAAFANTAPGSGLAYSVSKAGFSNASGTLSVVSSNVAQAVALSAVAAPTYTVTFTVRDASNALVAGASVIFNNQTLTTTVTGEVVFDNVSSGIDQAYSISKTGFTPASGLLNVTTSNLSQQVVITALTIPDPEPPLVATLNPRNIFSPNGDGANEVWEVVGIEQQPELRVLIFNGLGQKVFQAQPYTNSWDGAGLPEGVYYYQLQNQQGKPVKKGAITLVR